MDIRIVDEMDMPALWKLWVRGLYDYPEAFGASYEWAKDVSVERSRELLRQIREGEGFILGAFEQGIPVGMLNFTRQQGEKFRHKGDIGAVYVTPEQRGSAVYVTPEQRGKGVAKALLSLALEKTRAMADLVIISLSVNAENAAAIRLYESSGFKAYGVEPKGLRVNDKYCDLVHMTYEWRENIG
jgi:RimJ/RimL family protein N-acetyltransferase